MLDWRYSRQVCGLHIYLGLLDIGRHYDARMVREANDISRTKNTNRDGSFKLTSACNPVLQRLDSTFKKDES